MNITTLSTDIEQTSFSIIDIDLLCKVAVSKNTQKHTGFSLYLPLGVTNWNV